MVAGVVVVEVSEDRSTVDDLHIIICGAEEGVKATTLAMAARHTTEHRAILTIVVMYGKGNNVNKSKDMDIDL